MIKTGMRPLPTQSGILKWAVTKNQVKTTQEVRPIPQIVITPPSPSMREQLIRSSAGRHTIDLQDRQKKSVRFKEDIESNRFIHNKLQLLYNEAIANPRVTKSAIIHGEAYLATLV